MDHDGTYFTIQPLTLSNMVGHRIDMLKLLGECSEVMKNYLACMKKVRGVNQDECRNLAKSYLACRMDKYALLPSKHLSHTGEQRY